MAKYKLSFNSYKDPIVLTQEVEAASFEDALRQAGKINLWTILGDKFGWIAGEFELDGIYTEYDEGVDESR